MSDESPERLELLFRGARSDRPRDAVRERTLARLLAAPASARTPRRVLSFVLAAAALALVVTALLVRAPERLISAERFGSSSVSPRLDPAVVKPTPPLVPGPDLPGARDDRDAARNQPAPAKADPSASRPMSLEDETSALARVRHELRSGNAHAALAALDRYDRAARGGHMTAEARLLRIEALKSAGKTDAAAVLAAEFVSAYPDSPLVERARKHLSPASDAGGSVGTGGR